MAAAGAKASIAASLANPALPKLAVRGVYSRGLVRPVAEVMRAIGERRIKRSPLRDVAGMLRSFHYASHAGLLTEIPGVMVRSQDSVSLTPWARFLYFWTSAVFVKAYLTQVGDTPFLPKTREELRCLLDTYLLEKSLYELDYEMNNRPTWISIPIRGVLDLMDVAREKKPTSGSAGGATSKTDAHPVLDDPA